METSNNFLETIFKGTQGLIEIRCLPSTEQLFSTDLMALQLFINSKTPTENVYFGVCTRRENGNGSKDSVYEVPALWCDIDWKDLVRGKDEADEILESFELMPSLVIASGHGYHTYWILAHPIEASLKVEGYLKGLAKELNADPAAAELARILRVPNTFNHKNGAKELVTIAQPDNGLRYDLDNFSPWYVEAPIKGKHSVAFSEKPPPDVDLDKFNLSPRITELILEGWQGIGYASRSEADQAIITALLKANATPEEIRGIFHHHAIGEKYREQGDKYLSHSISSATDFLNGKSYAEDNANGENGKGSKLKQRMLQTDRWVIVEYCRQWLEEQQATKQNAKFNVETKTVFPESAWAGLFKDYRDLVGPCTEAPDAYHWAWFLTALGLRIGRNIYTQSATRLYPNFYVLLIGQTARNRKSTVPTLGRFLITDQEIDNLYGVVSSEGIYELLSRREGTRLFIYQDEFRGLIQVARRQGVADIIPKLNQLYNCPDEDDIGRVQRVKIIRPFTSLVSGSPEGWLDDALTEGDVSGGFLSRFLFVDGKAKDPIPLPPPVDERGSKFILKDIEKQLTPWMKKPGVMEFSEEAKEIYRGFYAQWYAKQNELPDEVANLTNRTPQHVQKIAMIYSFALAQRSISPEALNIAIDIGDYLQDTTKRLFGNIGMTEVQKMEAKIRKQLEENGRKMLNRELQREVGRRTEVYNRAMDNMKRAEIIDIQFVPGSKNQKQKMVVLL